MTGYVEEQRLSRGAIGRSEGYAARTTLWIQRDPGSPGNGQERLSCRHRLRALRGRTAGTVWLPTVDVGRMKGRSQRRDGQADSEKTDDHGQTDRDQRVPGSVP